MNPTMIMQQMMNMSAPCDGEKAPVARRVVGAGWLPPWIHVTSAMDTRHMKAFGPIMVGGYQQGRGPILSVWPCQAHISAPP